MFIYANDIIKGSHDKVSIVCGWSARSNRVLQIIKNAQTSFCLHLNSGYNILQNSKKKKQKKLTSLKTNEGPENKIEWTTFARCKDKFYNSFQFNLFLFSSHELLFESLEWWKGVKSA